MVISRAGRAKARRFVAAIAASAFLLPGVAGAVPANHDVQPVSLHDCGGMRHDHAFGPGRMMHVAPDAN